MPCAPAHDGGAAEAAAVMAASPAHHHDHRADHAPAPAGDDHDAVASCNCGCANLCGASDIAYVRIETPERHAVAVSYVGAAQPVAGDLQFIDPGIPISLA